MLAPRYGVGLHLPPSKAAQMPNMRATYGPGRLTMPKLKEINERITQEELTEVFDETIPMTFVHLLLRNHTSPLDARRAVNAALKARGD